MGIKMKEKMKEIKVFIPVIIAISFLAMIVINGIKTYVMGRSELEKSYFSLENDIENSIYDYISMEKKELSMAAKLLLHDKTVPQLFAERNRSALLEYLFPVYKNELKKNFGIKQFQFHLPPAISFLRLHKPDKFGDDLSLFRKTVVEANREQKIISGLEVGRAGLGMRLVYPIYFEGKHIGTMEFGTDFNEILKGIAKKIGGAFAIGVLEDVFKKAGRFENSNNDIVKDNIVFYGFSNNIAKELLKKFSDKSGMKFIEKENKKYAVVSVPITDYSNSKIGFVTFFKDETELINSNTKNIIFGVLFPFFMAIIVLSLLVVIINKKLTKPIYELVNYTEELGNGNFSVKEPEVYFTALNRLTAAMGLMRDKIGEQFQMLNNLPTPVMKIDKDFNIEYININGAKIVDSDRHQLLGEKCYEYINTEHCNTEKCALAKAMNENRIVTEETTANPATGKFEIMYTGAPIKNKSGKVVSGLAFIADTTDVKQREAYLERSVNTILGAMDRFSRGDLTVTVKAEKKGDVIAKLFEGFNKAVENIRNMILQVQEAVQATASASAEISSGAEEVAAGAQEQSSQTSDVAAAMEEMSRTVIETASNATVAANASKAASDKAGEGMVKLNAEKEGMHKIVVASENTAKTISSLANKTEQIGEIVHVINDIAEQTNLLALNAAIEAARAGEQGRGFAVVADEVRSLAERTTKATKEIEKTISQIQVEAQDANKSMDEADKAIHNGLKMNKEVGAVLADILQSVEDISAQINQVAAASEEQSAAVGQVSGNIELINNVTGEAAASIQQIAAASEDLNKLTENLSDLVKRFQVDNGNAELKNGHLIAMY